MYHKQRGCFLATSGSHVTVSKYSGLKVSSAPQLRVTSVILSLFVVSASALHWWRGGTAEQSSCSAPQYTDIY